MTDQFAAHIMRVYNPRWRCLADYIGFAIAHRVCVRPMMRVITGIALALSLASNGSANEPGLPPINNKTLAGSWQGVSPYNPFVYRLEIAADEPSYLVWTWDSHPMR